MYTRPSFIGTYNIRKGFLDRDSLFSTQFSSDFDEPTYLSFKLNFYSDERLTDEMTYDTLPQALFTPPNFPDGNPYDRWMDWATDDELREIIAEYQYDPESFVYDRKYSAFNYLLDRNEDFRAFLLAKFLKGWAELQEQYQFYFQSVSGLDKLLESNPSRGSKLSKDTVVTIECLEAIDQRVKYLLSLYKAAAWDDEYQRWILPDIYRYFKMDIFISEIRTFHVSNFSDQGSALNLITNTATNLINKGLSWVNSKLDKWTKGGLDNNIRMDLETLSVINGICPVTCIHCELCDFDISNPYYQGSYDINNSTAEKTTIKIKVKKAEIIHNWTLIDRIFGNLLNATERGTKSMTSSVGWRDYLKMDGGALAQNTFNNTILMSDKDLKKDYNGIITGGWISRTISNGINALKGAMSGGSILDFAADIYSTVKSAIADKKANEERNTISKATSRNKSDIPSMTIKGGHPDDELLNETLVTISNGTATSDEIVKSALQLLRQTNTKFKDLSSEQQDSVRKALEKMRLADMSTVSDKQSKNDRSWATDLDGGTYLQKNTKLQGMSAIEQNLTPLDSSALDFSMSEVVVDKSELNFVISGGSITQPQDRSEATDLDGMDKEIEISLSGASPKDASLTPIEGQDSSFVLTSVYPKPEEDRSWATDLDGLDYQESMTSPIDTSINFVLSDVSILSTDDRSWATDLDGLSETNMTGIEMGEDRSLATDLDGLNESSMTNVDMGEDRSMATDLDGLEESTLTSINMGNDRSMATDLDGLNETVMTNVNMGDDRSLATDLDGINSTQMVNIDMGDDRSMATDLDGLNETSMTGIVMGEDRSLATNLDGINPTQMTNVDMGDDRSLATDLDGLNESTLTSINMGNDRSLATDLDNINPTQMTNVDMGDDRSMATDLDGINETSMTNIDMGEDRSAATDLDGLNETSMTNVDMGDDRSLATDLDGINPTQMVNVDMGEDRSLATDLDGLNNEPMTSIIPSELNLELTNPGVQKEDDRSWATDLDGITTPSMSKIDMGEDRSLATDLNGLNSGVMTNIDMNIDKSAATDLDGQEPTTMTLVESSELNLELTDPGVQKETDRSLATDLDGQSTVSMTSVIPTELNTTLTNPGLQTESDRSSATDLDGQTTNEMTTVVETEHSVILTDPGVQKESDRSLATDLDGQTLNGMSSIINTEVAVSLSDPGVQKEDDRSMATDLDGQSFGPMTSIESNSYQSVLTDPGLQKESDRSSATDLDGQNIPSMTEVTQTESPFETIMSGIVQNNERNENLDFGEITGPEESQTEINGGNISPFESLSTSTATSQQSLESAVHVSQETELNQSEEMIFLDNGDINPDATVGDILEQYSEFVKNPPKNSTLQDVKIEGNTEKRNNIISPRIVGNDNNKKMKSVL